MKKSAWLALPAVLVLLVAPAAPQSHNTFPQPPPSLDTTPTEKNEAASTRRIDLAQLQREADDLARTAQTIPTDVASVRKGMLPKDVIDKLKQIEKLSKRLRLELTP